MTTNPFTFKTSFVGDIEIGIEYDRFRDFQGNVNH